MFLDGVGILPWMVRGTDESVSRILPEICKTSLLSCGCSIGVRSAAARSLSMKPSASIDIPAEKSAEVLVKGRIPRRVEMKQDHYPRRATAPSASASA